MKKLILRTLLLGAAIFAVTATVIHTDRVEAGPLRNLLKGEKSEVVHVTDATAKQEIDNATVPVLIDFYATWCPPCQRVGPNIEAIAKLYKGKVKVVKIDGDLNPQLMKDYGVTAYPTIMIIKPKTLKANQPAPILGYQSMKELQDYIDAALKP